VDEIKYLKREAGLRMGDNSSIVRKKCKIWELDIRRLLGVCWELVKNWALGG
jgi:hypothetical protein